MPGTWVLHTWLSSSILDNDTDCCPILDSRADLSFLLRVSFTFFVVEEGDTNLVNSSLERCSPSIMYPAFLKRFSLMILNIL